MTKWFNDNFKSRVVVYQGQVRTVEDVYLPILLENGKLPSRTRPRRHKDVSVEARHKDERSE